LVGARRGNRSASLHRRGGRNRLGRAGNAHPTVGRSCRLRRTTGRRRGASGDRVAGDGDPAVGAAASLWRTSLHANRHIAAAAASRGQAIGWAAGCTTGYRRGPRGGGATTGGGVVVTRHRTDGTATGNRRGARVDRRAGGGRVVIARRCSGCRA
jgi:hypothetical protein